MFGKKEVTPPQGFSSRSQDCAQNYLSIYLSTDYLSSSTPLLVLALVALSSCRFPMDNSYSSWFALDFTFLLFSGAKCRCRTESDFYSIFLTTVPEKCWKKIAVHLSFEVEMSRVEYDHFIKGNLPFVAFLV